MNCVIGSSASLGEKCELKDSVIGHATQLAAMSKFSLLYVCVCCIYFFCICTWVFLTKHIAQKGKFLCYHIYSHLSLIQ